MFSTDFFKMLAIQEAFSIAKNSGAFELIMWVVGARKTFPYGDPKTIRLLKSKAMVDSLSEVLAGFAACAIFSVETEVSWRGDGELHISKSTREGPYRREGP